LLFNSGSVCNLHICKILLLDHISGEVSSWAALQNSLLTFSTQEFFICAFHMDKSVHCSHRLGSVNSKLKIIYSGSCLSTWREDEFLNFYLFVVKAIVRFIRKEIHFLIHWKWVISRKRMRVNFFNFFEAGSPCAAQAGQELLILLPLLSTGLQVYTTLLGWERIHL
jgi:hypothetical protein